MRSSGGTSASRSSSVATSATGSLIGPMIAPLGSPTRRYRPRTVSFAVLRCGAVATSAEVDRTIKRLVRRLSDATRDPKATLPRGERSLAVVIPDLDLVYTGSFSSGAISNLRKGGPAGDEDVKVTVSSDDLVALADGRLGVAGALLWGKLRVDAGARDLLLLRQLF